MDARYLALAAAVLLSGALAPVASAQTQQVAPDVRNLDVTPTAFKALPTGGPLVLTGGGLVEFDLRDGARVAFTFRTIKIGKREGGKCKPGKAKSKKKRCEIFGPVPGSMLYVAFSGHNEFRFSGRIDNKLTLTPGTYRLIAKAAGTAARSSYATFKIIK